MRELQRRHDEFRRLLLGDHSAFGLGPAILTSTQNPFVITDAATNVPVSRRVDVFCIMGRNKRSACCVKEEEERREMDSLRERLDELERAQQQQLEELDGWTAPRQFCTVFSFFSRWIQVTQVYFLFFLRLHSTPLMYFNFIIAVQWSVRLSSFDHFSPRLTMHASHWLANML